MTDPYLQDLEFANKANIEAARKFKAERDALAKALMSILTIIDDLDQYQKRPERGDYGVECACCMGELFDADDRQKIEAARGSLPTENARGEQP